MAAQKLIFQQLKWKSGEGAYVSIADVEGLSRLPYSLRIMLENLMRHNQDGRLDEDIHNLLSRKIGARITFNPTRIFGQDILGKVMMVDLAALRDSLAENGLDPHSINPAVPVDIIIDHSLQVDYFGTKDAPRLNLAKEYARNGERFAFLRWCAESFKNVRVVPPGKGIMHQIHIENIAQVVWIQDGLLSPDTCIGTDSHTPMVNGLGVLGWGVGGIEAEAVMLGKSVSMALPRVIGIEVTGALSEGVMPTDIVLTIAQILRSENVVGEFVEFFGEALPSLSVADRGTIANMAPEYGATAVYFPIDQRTLDYLKMTGRNTHQIELIEAYAKAQRLWYDEIPHYDSTITINLSEITPSIAGPKNPEDRLDLSAASTAFTAHSMAIAGRAPVLTAPVAGADYALKDGDIVIAAITSCTNTSNPIGMIAAGLVAQKAVELGLKVKPFVKTSLAPGSHVVASILENTGLQTSLDALGFQVVGFGCTTCNGGSGPLPPPIAASIEAKNLMATAVLSGNRNFQGRIHPNVRAAYLASPALVVAYAIAGNMTIDITRAPLNESGAPVYLKDIWPKSEEIKALVEQAYRPEIFNEKYATLFDGGEAWEALNATASARFDWQENSHYIQQPPYFQGLKPNLQTDFEIKNARPLAILGDSITTDDISPSGAISLGTPSADYLLQHGIKQADFNNYTTRRANHHVAIRATFANIRLMNKMIEREGGYTMHYPTRHITSIYEAAIAYQKTNTPLVVIAGNNYGCGSSRDWAAKGVALLGVKAIIAEGFERIHRTNLVGMGVLPLQFTDGMNAEMLALNGSETYSILGLNKAFSVRDIVDCRITRADGRTETIPLIVRLDTPEDITYWRNGGILPTVWREYMERAA